MFVRISIQANVVSLTTPKSKILLLCYRIHNNASCPTSSSKQTSIHPHFRSPYPASKSHPLSSHLRAPLAPSPIQATGLFIESFATTQNLVHGPQLKSTSQASGQKNGVFLRGHTSPLGMTNPTFSSFRGHNSRGKWTMKWVQRPPLMFACARKLPNSSKYHTKQRPVYSPFHNGH